METTLRLNFVRTQLNLHYNKTYQLKLHAIILRNEYYLLFAFQVLHVQDSLIWFHLQELTLTFQMPNKLLVPQKS